MLAVQVGACKGGKDASSGELAPAEDGPTIGGLERMLEHRLVRVGLHPHDLAAHAATEADYAAYEAAIRAGDTAEARARHARILTKLDALAADPDVAAEKLTRVKARLDAKARSLPEARVEALRAHLAKLEARLEAPGQTRAVSTALSSFERKLAD